jgi:hypothetical protein
MNSAIASRIPLVCRPKPPGAPLAARIEQLTALTAALPGADHHQQVARASGVLNFAALIASDASVPGLAARLCWRQWDIFTQAGPLEPDIATMALMPLVNIARLLIREGDGDSAYDVLQRLYRAAQQRGTTTIHDHRVDLSPWTRTTAAHRKLCEELWVTILVDGARALARGGRWAEAARTMASHRGIGSRLLDGRQITIMALAQQGHHQEAIAMIDSTVPAEPWEHTVAAILRICCRPVTPPAPQDELDHAAREALTLTVLPEPMTAAFRTRVGLAALDLTDSQPTPYHSRLRAALISAAACDAYAARDVLSHHLMRSQLTPQQEHELATVITTAGLGTQNLPAAHIDTLSTAVSTAEEQLRTLLAVPRPEPATFSAASRHPQGLPSSPRRDGPGCRSAPEVCHDVTSTELTVGLHVRRARLSRGLTLEQAAGRMGKDKGLAQPYREQQARAGEAVRCRRPRRDPRSVR